MIGHLGPSISSKRLNILFFLHILFFSFVGTLKYLSIESLNVLLHYRPFLLWVREGICPLPEEQKQIGLSPSSWKALQSCPPGSCGAVCPRPAPFQGSVEITGGSQWRICLILIPKEGPCQMLFLSV